MIYDLVVIGAGPGGYPAAVAAAQAGLKVAIVEKEHLGGVCLNWGCIPTKSLLKASEHVAHIKDAANWGINVELKGIEIEKMVAQSRATVQKLSNGIASLFKNNKIELITATAKISKVGGQEITLLCNNKELKTKNLIIATGSKARTLPEAPESEHIWGIREAMTPSALPKNIAIIGAGAIGIEFAGFYSALGTNVTVFEMAPAILAGIDSEIAKTMQKQMEKDGVKFNLSRSISKIEEKDGKITIQTTQEQSFDKVIVAIGVTPNTADFNQLDLEKNYFKTNEKHQVSISGKTVTNIFAIGDCTKGPWLAHKATAEGLRAIKIILGKQVGALGAIPLCIYTSPQIASIGMTEDQLKEKHGANYSSNVKVQRSSFMANGKANAIQDSLGMIKILICAKTEEILGVHMIGPEVTEMIHSIALGMQLEALPEDFANTVFPHPTLSEIICETMFES